MKTVNFNFNKSTQITQVDSQTVTVLEKRAKLLPKRQELLQ